MLGSSAGKSRVLVLTNFLGVIKYAYKTYSLPMVVKSRQTASTPGGDMCNILVHYLQYQGSRYTSAELELGLST